MAYSRVQKRTSLLRRKLHILRPLTSSNSAKSTTTILQTYKLVVALETIKKEYEELLAIKREYLSLLNHVQQNKDVKVKEVSAGTFAVMVTCEKGGDKLVAILEAFEDMCLNVQQAKVSCENGFSLKAIAVAEDQTMGVRDVTEALVKAIRKQSGDKEDMTKA